MRNAIVGSFVGFLLAAVLLAACGGGGDVAPQANVEGLTQEVAALRADLSHCQNVLAHFSRYGDDIYITGANLHVVNGLDDTRTVNGLGNIVVGYNEGRENPSDDDRTGSHMVVVGQEHNYSSFGGIVVGHRNTTSGIFSVVSGGSLNTASGSAATVAGGTGNGASGVDATVSGGSDNTASGRNASVSGGSENRASGECASVGGGTKGTAEGTCSSVVGGGTYTFGGVVYGNVASGDYSTIAGGGGYDVTGYCATARGGTPYPLSRTKAPLPGEELTLSYAYHP